MNANQANNLDLPDLLSRLGHQPIEIKKNGAELWYRSPFREEKDASFHISKGHTWPWVWNDFADEGGTVMDFVMRYQGHRSFKKALAFLDGLYKGNSFFITSSRVGESSTNQLNLFSFHGQTAAKPPKIFENGGLEFISASSIENSLIHHYLEQRQIPKKLADRYLLEVKYRNKSKNRVYFAFGMENRSGGFEIRAASDEYKFKSALKIRDITVITGAQSKCDAVNVFEGMTDFLSFLVLKQQEAPIEDCIILHSLSSFSRAVLHIEQHAYATIYTYLDNNSSGLEYTEKFVIRFGDRATAQNTLFSPHIDLNDALLAGVQWDLSGK